MIGYADVFQAPQRPADAKSDRGELSFAGSVVLHEIFSGTTIVGVRRYRGRKAGSVSYVTSVPSDYMGETWICIQGMSIEENDYLSDQFLYPENPEGNGRDFRHEVLPPPGQSGIIETVRSTGYPTLIKWNDNCRTPGRMESHQKVA